MQGALQLMVRITGTKNSETIHLDDVFVLGQDIAVGDGFRRITHLSQKQIAIVGVNVRVECTIETNTSDCSESPTLMPTIPIIATTTTSSFSISAPSLGIGLLIGALLATVLTLLVNNMAICLCLYSQRKKKQGIDKYNNLAFTDSFFFSGGKFRV